MKDWASILKTATEEPPLTEEPTITEEPQPEPNSQNQDDSFLNGYGKPFEFSNDHQGNQGNHDSSNQMIGEIVDFQSGYGQPYQYPQEM